MKRLCLLVIFLSVIFLSDTIFAGTTVYTNKNDFLSAISPGYYYEDFDSYTFGSYTGSSIDLGPVNGFSYTIAATNDVKSGDGNMSLENSYDVMNISFTGSDVTAIGGNFWTTDENGQNKIGQLKISLSDGFYMIVYDIKESIFFGFISDSDAYTSMSLENVSLNYFPTVDNFYVGIPVPGTFVLSSIGVGVISLLHRRKKL